MKVTVHNSLDVRQSLEWGVYLQKMGWHIERVGKTIIFIHSLPFLNRSVIKIQHPIGPIPFKQIEEVSKKYRALFIVIEPHAYRFDEDLYKKSGYSLSKMQFAHTATIKIDLQRPESTIFSSFSENAKRNIRKSQKNNLIIKEVWYKDDKNDFYFKKFYSLLMELSKKKKFYSPSYDEYHKKVNAFKKSSIFLFAYERGNPNPIAVVWYAMHSNLMTYMQTGITQRGYDLLANYLLVWEGLLIAKREQVKIFDFESIYDKRFPNENKKWIGYSEFKKRFHGELIEYPQPWIKFYNPLIKWFYICSTLFSR